MLEVAVSQRHTIHVLQSRVTQNSKCSTFLKGQLHLDSDTINVQSEPQTGELGGMHTCTARVLTRLSMVLGMTLDNSGAKESPEIWLPY